jgi:magnesium-protoporphyrin O-methyltransferase
LRDLNRFRKKGPSKSTKILIDTIVRSQNRDLKNKSLLDIGSGIAAIGLTLNEKGSVRVINVDVSKEYLNKAEDEVTIQGFKDRFEFINGDFLDIAEDLPRADIVTLDKSICCYRDFKNLVQTSIIKSKNIFGIVIPRDTWWVILINNLGNFIRIITGNKFRTFVHPVDQIIEITKKYGFTNKYSQTAWEWLILVFVLEREIDTNLS